MDGNELITVIFLIYNIFLSISYVILLHLFVWNFNCCLCLQHNVGDLESNNLSHRKVHGMINCVCKNDKINNNNKSVSKIFVVKSFKLFNDVHYFSISRS